ncbi:MAG: hypothetical protein M5U09_09420 [Gammaproteobacteria bacterium]|nr:hypothetical protein [Gammaproteobacteria bacterium]
MAAFDPIRQYHRPADEPGSTLWRSLFYFNIYRPGAVVDSRGAGLRRRRHHGRAAPLPGTVHVRRTGNPGAGGAVLLHH